MFARTIVAAAVGLTLTASLSGCLKKDEWRTHELGRTGPDAPPAVRAELESRRSAALASSDPAVFAEYLRYLWQFDWEYRHFIARVEAGKSVKLPEDLDGFDREQYVQEAIGAWAQLRPRELPGDRTRGAVIRADLYATAVGWGCRDSERAFGKYLLYFAELGEDEYPSHEDFALLAAECGYADGSTERACRTAADLAANLTEPEYDDIDLDKAPEPSVRINLLKLCSTLNGNREWMSADEVAILDNFQKIDSTWFEVHYPEEYAAMVEARRQAAIEAAEAAAQYEAEWGSSSSSSSGSSGSSDGWGGGGGGSSHGGGSSGGSSGGPSGPVRVSITLRSSCQKTIKVFFGDNPGFGSGRTTSVSYNTVQSIQMNEGEMFWILDDNGKGISSFTASRGRTSIEINSSCSGFR